MSQNTIIKGKNNPVIIEFTGVDLTQFTNIQVKYGSDIRTLADNPASVVVNSSTELELNFQDTTETSSQYWCINGFNNANPNGIELTSACLGNLPKSPICEGC